MTDNASLFDTDVIRNALQESGLAPSDLAFRVDFSVKSLQRLLEGEAHPGEIRLATLARLADNLGLPLRSLFAEPTLPPFDSAHGSGVPDTEASPEDATTVIGLIYDRGAPTLNHHIAEALQWPIDRLRHALREADRRLRPAGLRIVRQHGESTIRPLHEHTKIRSNLRTIRAPDRKSPHTDPLRPNEHKAAHQVLREQRVNAANDTRRVFLEGRLTNVGVLDTSGESATLSRAAAFAHPSPKLEAGD